MATQARAPADFTWPSLDCPYPFYEVLREQAPVYKYPGRNDYLVSRWEDIVHVAEHPELFGQTGAAEREGKLPPTGAFDEYACLASSASNPPEHWQKRQLGLLMVDREAMRSYEPLVRRICDERIDGFVDRGECEFHYEFADMIPLLAIVAILGLDPEHAETYRRWGQREGTGARYLDEERLAADRALMREQNEYFQREILERYERPRNDFLSEFVHAQVERDGELDLPFLIGEAGLFLFAGNVTTTHMLTSMMLLLLEHPDQMERVVADHSLIRPLVEEALRVESPVQFLHRYVKVDTEIGGVPVPAGAQVVIMLGSGNRDDARFEHPDEFRIDRPDVVKHQIAFGRGSHLCLGAPLARLEGVIAFEQLLTRLRNIRLAPGKNDFAAMASLGFRAPDRLHVEFEAA